MAPKLQGVAATTTTPASSNRHDGAVRINVHPRRRRKPASMAIKVRAGPNIEAVPMPRTLDHTHTDVDCAERPQTMRAHRRMSMQHTVDLDNTVLTEQR